MGKEIDKDKVSSMYHFNLFYQLKSFNKQIPIGTDIHRGPPSISPVLLDQEILPPAGIERDTFLQQARTDITHITELMTTIANVYNLEPIYIELMKDDGEKLKTRDELFQESFDALESMFLFELIFFSISILQNNLNILSLKLMMLKKVMMKEKKKKVKMKKKLRKVKKKKSIYLNVIERNN